MSAGESRSVLVNGQPRICGDGTTLFTLVDEMGLADKKGVAVAVNGVVVPRSDWDVQTLAADDRVLVIQATQGG
jgi:sulfur carrier protein